MKALKTGLLATSLMFTTSLAMAQTSPHGASTSTQAGADVKDPAATTADGTQTKSSTHKGKKSKEAKKHSAPTTNGVINGSDSNAPVPSSQPDAGTTTGTGR